MSWVETTRTTSWGLLLVPSPERWRHSFRIESTAASRRAYSAHSKSVSVAATGPGAVPQAREESAYRSTNEKTKPTQTRLQLLPGSRSRYDPPSTGSTDRRSAATRRLES